jgi:L-rhamnose mutarotase
MKRFCFALDLNDDPAMIAEYENIHKQIWPEIKKSILDAGITTMDIYRAGDRMFMIMETTDDFEFENKDRMDAGNPIVQKWEAFMWKFQKPLPFAKPGEKWVMMKQIFQLQ